MVTKKEVNCDCVSAQSISKTQLKENSTKEAVCEPVISDVKSGHRKPDTGNKEIRIGPMDRRVLHFWKPLLPIAIC